MRSVQFKDIVHVFGVTSLSITSYVILPAWLTTLLYVQVVGFTITVIY